MDQQPQIQVQRAPRGGRGRLIVVAVLAVIVAIFIAQNRVGVKMNFLWLHFTWPAWLIIVLSLVIGVVAGLLIGAYARRPKK
ncbi:MAG TPA: LapA family protein [Thermoleophilia bacterium]|nr:LapA family protein [Thermoleophilia bacterium]HQG04550.1 LapA family protein [Thermoleophilia bacterium]HQJ98727.1 LapA family protein [Thermoleophilia bacterium]